MPDGVPLLRQFKVFETREPARGKPGRFHVGVYLQSFMCSEVYADFHIHRWRRMVSFVLSGVFQEERPSFLPGRRFVVRKAGDVYTMGAETVHRFNAVAARTWTLFFMFGRNPKQAELGGWGYYPP